MAICTASGDQYYPQLISDGSGGAIITWYDYRSGNADIYAQRVDSSGAVQWIGDGVAICTASGDQWSPQLVSDGSGGAIITWWDYRGGNADIYAQRVDSGGAVKWATNDVAICTASGDQSVPQLISDGSGGAIITWEDYRSGTDYDIYAQMVDSSGSLPVNHAPVAVNDSYGTNEDTTLNVAASGVLANDSDADGDPLTASLVSDVSHGTLVLNADGSFAYTPAAHYNGSDSFTYKANDGAADSNTATVNITVDAVNDVPVAVDDEYGVPGDTTLVVEAPGVLENDSDADGNTLSSVLVSTTSHGSLTLNLDGSFTYTPVASYDGSDSFTYKANDGTADSNTVTVSINVHAVNHPPVAVDDDYSTSQDTALEIPAWLGVLANDTDQDGDYLIAVLVSNASHGTAALNSDGVFTYVPDAGFTGTDSFTYKASDELADSNVATVTITVNAVNHEPVAADDEYGVPSDTTLVVDAPGVLENDSDVDDDTLSSVLVNTTSHGSLTLNPDGSFTYTPDAGFSDIDLFTYRASDSTDYSNMVTVTINVHAVNHPPVAVDDEYSTSEDTGLEIPAVRREYWPMTRTKMTTFSLPCWSTMPAMAS